MSTDLLRRAATKLRDHAQAASPGPWTTYIAGTGIRSSAPYAWVIAPAGAVLERQNAGAVGDVQYATLMHPPVALALADLFDRIAWMVKFDSDFSARVGVAETLALARTILREDTDDA